MVATIAATRKKKGTTRSTRPRDSRRRNAEFELGQRLVLERIAAGAPLRQVLEEIVLLIERQASGMLCSILLLDRGAARVRHGAAPNLPRALVEGIDGAQIGPREGSCGAAAYLGREVIVEDIAAHPNWARYKQLVLPAGLLACWSSPILSRPGGNVVGTFAMYYRRARGPTASERKWVARATHLAAIAINRDRAEQAAVQADEARRTSDRLRDLMYAAVTDVLFYLGVEGNGVFRFLSVNPAFLQTTGLTENAVIGRTVDEVIPEPSLTLVLGRYAQAMRERRTISWDEVTPYPAGVKYGEVSITPLFDAAGNCTNLVGMVHDVTERRLNEERMFHTQRLESLGLLAGGIAHDFNNLLMAIICNAGVAQESVRDQAAVQEALAEIEKASARGAALVRQLLTFSRRQESSRTRTKLAPLVAEAFGLLRTSLRGAIRFETHFDPDVPDVLADPTQIHQVVMNLGTNAAHAIGSGSGAIELQIERVVLERDLDLGATLLRTGTYARLRVTDTGVGMDAATLDRIFDPFFTTKPAGEGTGLGLSVVHGIVKKHEGGIVVRSTPGRGTEFSVYFPAAPGSPAGPSSSGSTQQPDQG